MYWQITLGILVLINSCSIVLTKVAADKIPKKSLGTFYQFLICVLIAIIYVVFLEKTSFSSISIIIWFSIGIIGFINAFGNYCQWQASALNLSKTVLFFPLMEVWAIILAIIFLKEIVLWNAQLILGTVLCFLAMWLFRLPGSKDKTEEASRKWLFFTLRMILIFGTAGFLLKFFSFTVPRGNFLMAWYIGAFLGAVLILVLEKQNPIQVSGKTILTILPVSITILGTLFILYWTYQLGGPISLVLPIRGLAITLIPVFFGWLLFKEKKNLSRREWLGFLIGIIGAIIVLLR